MSYYYEDGTWNIVLNKRLICIDVVNPDSVLNVWLKNIDIDINNNSKSYCIVIMNDHDEDLSKYIEQLKSNESMYIIYFTKPLVTNDVLFRMLPTGADELMSNESNYLDLSDLHNEKPVFNTDDQYFHFSNYNSSIADNRINVIDINTKINYINDSHISIQRIIPQHLLTHNSYYHQPKIHCNNQTHDILSINYLNSVLSLLQCDIGTLVISSFGPNGKLKLERCNIGYLVVVSKTIECVVQIRSCTIDSAVISNNCRAIIRNLFFGYLECYKYGYLGASNKAMSVTFYFSDNRLSEDRISLSFVEPVQLVFLYDMISTDIYFAMNLSQLVCRDLSYVGCVPIKQLPRFIDSSSIHFRLRGYKCKILLRSIHSIKTNHLSLKLKNTAKSSQDIQF